MKIEPQYILTLSPTPSDIPAIVRLRRALKVLVRTFNLRAVDVREIPAGDSGSDIQPNEKDISIYMTNTCDTNNTDCISVGGKNDRTN